VAEAFKTYQCGTCGFIYDEAEGLPDEGFPPGTRWADIPDDWICPDCSMTKAQFEMVEL
jgi:rubredoxin